MRSGSRPLSPCSGLFLLSGLACLFAVPAAADDPAPTTMTIHAWQGGPTRFLEREGPFLFYVVLDQSAPKGGVQVSMQAGAASTASAGSDYTLPGTFTIPEGETFSTIGSITIIDDAVQESDETIVLTATTTPALAVTGQTLTIVDDDDGTTPPDPEVFFLVAGTVPEQAGALLVRVAVRNGAPTGGVRVELQAAAASTASAGTDYTLPGVVMISEGDQIAAVSIGIVDDSTREADETIVLTAVTAPPLTVRESTIRIIDDDDDAGGGGGPGTPPGDDDDDDEDDDEDGGGPGAPPGDDDGDGEDGGGPGTPPGDDEDGGGPGTPPGDDEDGGGPGTPPGDDDGPPSAAIEPVGATCDGELCRAVTGEAVRFIDASTGKVLSRRWELGDGTTSRSARAEHSWSSPGFYDVTLTVGDGDVESTASLTFLVEASEPAGTCEPDDRTLCLLDSRYAVSIDWNESDGTPRTAAVVHAGTNNSGLFRFFGRDNWEVLIKILDGCASNGNVWVLGASATDIDHRITIVDTVTSVARRYPNGAASIIDGEAFPQGCDAAAPP